MPDIVITEFMDEAALEPLKAHFKVVYDPHLVDREHDLAAALRVARALIVRNRTQVRGAVLASAVRLECVGRLGVGLDNIDMDACSARGIAVYPATGANTLAVAEYVLGAALVLTRKVWHATPDVIAGKWPRQQFSGGEIAGKVLGLVGFGAIAREVASRATAFGMTIVAHDPFLPSDHPAWQFAAPRALADLLAEADIVSLHVPFTPDTQALIDARALSRMKPGAILINTARGEVIDQAAVAQALKSGKLGGAALDVFEREPLSAAEAAIFANLPNLILTPHIAGITAESNTRVSRMVADAVLRHLNGKT